ncbi:hypothetical protein NEOLEDRAFT_1130046 [Neolentinus lepideus HHB14362 ss-1]|uniref:Uncharacterized protein n=1 Tax=Neolentinus lepideus HHB14362 ss-1 TaxID=1314782 RepID=A0A165UFP2_9AGAM|nr:hypothetical protein NEOLEDRAFT_1130046 [Neolentinus lepideus HHB14362 ss-1]
MAVRASSTVTHLSSGETRVEIAKKTPALLEIIHETPKDPEVMELAIVVFAMPLAPWWTLKIHLTQRSSDTSTTSCGLVAELKKPSASHYLNSHTVDFVPLLRPRRIRAIGLFPRRASIQRHE